jgi:drug/metabolite transporter (DMT)-like permease
VRTGASGGKIVCRIASGVAVAAFFLPWVSCPGWGGRTTLSGAQLAQSSGLLWLVLLCMLAAFGVCFYREKSAREAKIVAMTVIGAGALSVLALLVTWMQLNNNIIGGAFSIEFGAILALLGCVGTGASGFLMLAARSGAPAAPPGPEASKGASTAGQ